MSRLLTIVTIALLWTCGASAQSFDPWVNDDIDRRLWQAHFSDRDMEMHAALRPYSLRYGVENDSSAYRFAPSQALSFSPVVGLEAAYAQGLEGQDDVADGLAAVGLRLNFHPTPWLNLDADLLGVYAREERSTLSRASEVVPGVGRGHADEEDIVLFQPLFDLDLRPSKMLSVGLGNGKQFFGHGFRSLILSDNASPYPYLRMDVDVWHLHYMSLFSKQEGVLDVFSEPSAFEGKYTATHLLSWNVSPGVDVQIFESIIWQAEDSLSDRGFDVNYLNPIIFYRPVEFAQGSADNAILGLGMSFKIHPTYQLYFQVALDEFLLRELRSGDGWWGNKFGTQIGLKGYDVMGIEGLYAQAEYNLARPFTYSHGSPLQSYSHLNEPLAHPLGANFYEGVLIGSYRWKKFEVREQLTYEQYGLDGDAGNLGGNILRSYVGPEKQYGNFIGQGDRYEAVTNSLWFSYIMEEASDLRLQVGYRYRLDFGPALDAGRHYVTIGGRMNFRDAYR